MRILLVSQRYYPFIGGVETQVRLIAHELSKQHHVEVAAVNFEAVELPSRLGILQESLLVVSYASHQDGVVPVRALTPSLMDRLRMVPIAARVIPRLRHYAYHALMNFGYRWYRSVYLPKLKACMQQIDLVHVLAHGYLGWAAQEVALEQNIPFVCTPFVHPQQWGDDEQNIAYYKRADAIIALSQSDRRYLHSLGIPVDKLHTIGVIPNLPSTSDPGSFRRRHGLGDAPVVLYTGRMMPQKGAKALLEAMNHVWKRMPHVHFVFVGPSTKESASWFEEYTDQRVRYLGKVRDQEKADAFAACDVFCLPSLSEILPTVYLEAWSYSKPVIGGKAEGLPELVEENRAGLTVRQDGAEISEVILDLLQDPARRREMGEQGKALVEQHYSTKAVVGALEELYDQLVRGILHRDVPAREQPIGV